MPENRYFVDQPLHLEEKVTLPTTESHHLFVMRKMEGDEVELVNGKWQHATGKILSVEKKSAVILVTKVETKIHHLPKLILCQGICLQNKLDLIIEKATELGASSIWLYPGEKSVKKEISPSRLQGITIAAMKQCGRFDLPEIVLKPAISKWKKEELLPNCFFGDLNENAPAFSSISRQGKDIQMIIGPESGFTESERQQMLALGIQGVRLHPNVLRTETAALLSLSVLSHE